MGWHSGSRSARGARVVPVSALVVVALILGVGACGDSGTGNRSGGSAAPLPANRSTRQPEVLGEVLDRNQIIAVTPYEKQAFTEIALTPAVAGPARHSVLARWTHSPRFRILGNPTPEDLAQLSEAAQRWSIITGLHITVSLGRRWTASK